LQNPLRCGACGRFPPPDPRRDHFRTLGMPRAFDLDLEKLEAAYLELSRTLHPDHVAGDPAMRTRAVLHLAQVNDAYQVLRDWQRRADYLLGLEGGPSAAEHKQVPDGFLMEMMDWRGSLEEALDGQDTAALAGLRGRLHERLDACREDVAQGFRESASAPRPAVREALNVAAYYRSLLRDLEEQT
jgi:molecular chaperone HscB